MGDMDSTCQLSFKDHDGFVKKRVKRFRKSNFLTDVQIIGQNGSVYLHKVIIQQKLPRIAQFLCELCDHLSETTFILPEVSKDDIEREVKNLYTFGIVSGVEELFGIGTGNNSNIVKLENESYVTSEATNEDIDNIATDYVENMGTIIQEPSQNFTVESKIEIRAPKLKIKEVDEFQEHT